MDHAFHLRSGPRPPLAGDYQALHATRDAHSRYFAAMLAGDHRLGGCVLDVGAGEKSPSLDWFHLAYDKIGTLDGVDPREVVLRNTRLRNRWHSTVEEAPIPPASYDAALAMNVLEHVFDPVAFLKAVHRALKPGGVFYALTPHGRHPFPLAVRLVQALGLKGRMAIGSATVNEYPALYRCNTAGAVRRAAAAAGFAHGEVHLHPCLNWDKYFPRRLRFIPHAYDFLFGARFLPLAQQMLVKLEKGG